MIHVIAEVVKNIKNVVKEGNMTYIQVSYVSGGVKKKSIPEKIFTSNEIAELIKGESVVKGGRHYWLNLPEWALK